MALAKDRIVTLDVGGRLYKTTSNKLASSGVQLFKSLLVPANQEKKQEIDEPLYIDGHPDIFEDVLYFLRCSKLRPLSKQDPNRLEELQTEAELFGYSALGKECRKCLMETKKPKARSHKATLAGDWVSGNYSDLEIKFEEGEEDHVVYLVSATVTADVPETDTLNQREAAPSKSRSTRSLEFTPADMEFPDRFRPSFKTPDTYTSTPKSSSGNNSKKKQVQPEGNNSKKKQVQSDAPGDERTRASDGKKIKFFSSVVSKLTGNEKNCIGNDPKAEIRRRASTRSPGIMNFTLHCNYVKSDSLSDDCYLWDDKDMTIITFDIHKNKAKNSVDVTKNIGVFLSQQPGFGTLSLSVSGPGEWELFYWKGPVDKIPLAGSPK